VTNIATHSQIHYTFDVEYPFPPVGIVGAADGKNRRAFLCVSGAQKVSTRTCCAKLCEAFLLEVIVMN